MSELGRTRTPQPLSGKRVVDLSQFIAGPTAAMYLADFGAEVTKVESPQGDGGRTLPGNGFGSYYARSFNCGKRSVMLNLRDSADRAVLEAMLADAHAFVCNIAPGSLKGLELDGPTLRQRFPHLVVTLISGYGQHDSRPCMDTIAQCESGFAMLNGDEDGSPRLATSWPVDTVCGLYAGLSCAMALLDPRGQGCLIDLSMMEVAASALLGPAVLIVTEGDELSPPMGNRDRASAPSSIYACADGLVYILGGLDAYWARLKPLVGCDDDAPIAERIARAPEFDALVEAWTRPHRRDDVIATMRALQIPAGAVRRPEESIPMIRALRPAAVSRALPSGEHVPMFPALFDGERIERSATPLVGGPRRVSTFHDVPSRTTMTETTSSPYAAIQVLRPGVHAGRSALVTGAGSGIGRAIALRLAALGMHVFGTGRRAEALAETARLAEGLAGRFDHEPCNVRDTAAIEALVQKVGERQGIDLLVNNAGGQFFAPATGISRKGWDAVIDLNLSAVFVVTKAAYPFLKARRGMVVSISLSGVDRGSMGIAHSIAARAGVLGLTRSLALEWAKDDIALNCIGPGTVLTEGLADEAAKPMLDRLVAATPMGRPTSVDEVAELVAFLATPAAHLMTGQLIQIDGAAHLGAGLHMLAP